MFHYYSECFLGLPTLCDVPLPGNHCLSHSAHISLSHVVAGVQLHIRYDSLPWVGRLLESLLFIMVCCFVIFIVLYLVCYLSLLLLLPFCQLFLGFCFLFILELCLFLLLEVQLLHSFLPVVFSFCNSFTLLINHIFPKKLIS